MKNKILYFTVVLALLSSPVIAEEVELNHLESSVDPNETTKVAEVFIETEEDETVDLNDVRFLEDLESVEELNAEAEYEEGEIQGNKTVDIVVSPEKTTPVRSYTSRVEVVIDEQDYLYSFDFDVTPYEGWEIKNQSFQENVSIGSEGELGELTVVNIGNHQTSIDIDAEGEIADYLNYQDSITRYPDIEQNNTITYSIPSDVEFGEYSGNIILSNDYHSEELNVSANFEDTINPEIHDVQIDDFQATQGQSIVVEATDNIRVDSVSANIVYEEEVEEENQTYVDERVLEEIDFVHEANTNRWVGDIENDDAIGDYKVNIIAEDESGNSVEVTENLSISKLDAVLTYGNVDLPEHRYDNTVSERIMSVEQETEFDIVLEDFNRDLGSGDWDIGVDQDGDQTFFTEEGDSVTIEDTGDIDIVVYGENADRYRGDLSFDMIDQHVDVNDVQFSGEFVNFTTPEDETFSIYNTVFECDGEDSEVAEEAKWDCGFEIYATDVNPEESIQEQVEIVVPEQEREEIIESYERTIEDKESSEETAWTAVRLMLVITVASGFGFVYFINYYPTHYSVHRKSTSRTQRIKRGTNSILPKKIKNKISRNNKKY